MSRLLLRPLSLSEAPFSILEHAHWVPYSAGLADKFRPKASDAALDQKMFMRLRRLWHKQEIWLSHALECVLLGYGPFLLAEVFGGKPGGQEPCGLYSADWAEIKHEVGVPDLIAVRDKTLYLIEIKSGATPSKHRYSLQQHAKYMKFGAFAICSAALATEDDCAFQITAAEHWLVARSAQIEQCVRDYHDWEPSVGHDGQLTIGNGGVCDAIDSEVSSFVRANAEKHSLSVERYKDLRQMPTKLVTWPEFASGLKRVALNGQRPDLTHEADRLVALALGHAAIRTTA